MTSGQVAFRLLTLLGYGSLAPIKPTGKAFAECWGSAHLKAELMLECKQCTKTRYNGTNQSARLMGTNRCHAVLISQPQNSKIGLLRYSKVIRRVDCARCQQPKCCCCCCVCQHRCHRTWGLQNLALLNGQERDPLRSTLLMLAWNDVCSSQYWIAESAR